MPLPRWVARFNKRVTNRLLEPLARRFDSFGVVIHVGRTSGRRYRTPVNYFPAQDPDSLLVALTYGPRADWVQNVLAGGGTIEAGPSTRYILSAEHVGRAAAWPHLPRIVRIALRLLRVHDFLLLNVRSDTSQ